ncbi:LysR substrate-binding domain-containing protein [Paracandidimonas soli]|uniref:DNA-binding transcriptional LysR family regulator n=1 Tax=Paracandidimonas soli TaxID=1917182 RepID=A0A4R3USY2_9BURK|nr:LysR substrate-binding domain-containing protein [Paracandidimonas soli]TCU93144.1 DNA-binding transcriptional LysR family regulator [Paracandidimonas soli]
MDSDLSFFVLLARHKNLSAVARELDLTPPAATRRLQLMEERLGVRLANRTTRSISLTSEGELFLAHAARILADIKEMEDSVSNQRHQPRGLLRINASLGFGRRRISSLASAFAQKYPDIELDLQVSDKPVDLIANHIDLAIRFGALPDRRLVARRLLSNRRFLCASPKYLKRHGEPATVAELANHRCIIHNQNDEAHGIWRFTRNHHTEVFKVRGAMTSNDGDIALGWALDGHGIMIRSEWDLNRYVETRRLKILLPEFMLEPADLFLYYPSRQNLPARVRVFIDFVAERFAQEAPATKRE